MATVIVLAAGALLGTLWYVNGGAKTKVDAAREHLRVMRTAFTTSQRGQAADSLRALGADALPVLEEYLAGEGRDDMLAARVLREVRDDLKGGAAP